MLLEDRAVLSLLLLLVSTEEDEGKAGSERGGGKNVLWVSRMMQLFHPAI